MSSCFLRWFCFLTFPLHFPLLNFFLLFSQLVSFISNSQKCSISQNIWCLIKTQLKNMTQTIFQGGSPWATLIHNSVVCLEGTLLCPAASWGYFFFQLFPFPFPLLKFVSFYLASFFLESKPKAFQRISFSQAKKHEWSWYTIVWFVWGYTIVSSCFLRWFCFLTFPLHFPLLKLFLFSQLVSFI